MPLLFITFIVGVALSMTCCVIGAKPLPERDSPQLRDGRFQNPVPRYKLSPGQRAGMMWDFFFNKPVGTVPQQAIPVRPLSRAALLAAPDNTLYRLGHSTMLIKLSGAFYLTDPVFSERASPVQWAGPARFHAPPISIEELPPIKAVVISHDHYDHLDHAAIKALAAKTERFLTPLGVGRRLIDWGVRAEQVSQLDWWQETMLDEVRFIATPAQHFSGRGPTDENTTLWASWVIQHADLNLFFSGDTGYFSGFKEIGAKYGPFDVALMETGAYDELWPDVHMQPEETMQAFRDVNASWLLPVHNGTFDLGLHPWQEPFDRILDLATLQGVSITTPEMGEPVNLKAPHTARAWWRAAP